MSDTQLEKAVDRLNNEGFTDSAEWVEKLHASHLALLKQLRSVDQALWPDWCAVKEAIHAAEALERDGGEA